MFLFFVFLQIAVSVVVAAHECGRVPVKNVSTHTRPRRYIIDGTESVPHSRPWEVAIRFNTGEIACGGSVVSPYWILTAAHCIGSHTDPTDFFVHTGAHELTDQPGPKEQFVKIEEFYPHPEYNDRTITNDIGLIKLTSPVTYNEIVQPICLSAAIQEKVVPEAQMIVAGWGDTVKELVNQTEPKPGPHFPGVLLEVSVNLVSDEKCRKSQSKLDKTMFCAEAGNGAACHDDSGSPTVMQNSDGRWFQVGVVSYGAGCGDPNEYGFYNRAYNYCDFIESTIEEKICLPSLH